MSTRRCAIQPFTLSDGTKLNVGDWACSPSGAIMKNADNYPAPLEFNGFRFVEPRGAQSSGSAFLLQGHHPAEALKIHRCGSYISHVGFWTHGLVRSSDKWSILIYGRDLLTIWHL